MGTLGIMHYTAPETFMGEYGEECDIWSLGVTLCQLLTGAFPFIGKNDDEIYEKIQ